MDKGLIDRLFNGKVAGKNAEDIAIHGSCFLFKGKAENGSNGVGAESLHVFKIFVGIRELSSMMFSEIASSFMKITRTGIVTKPLPSLNHLFKGGGSKSANGRKKCHPPFEVGNDHTHLGLLQHHL
ncbi:hypothetical protein NEPTK9_000796 [Candidatus Neptunochlamydia vexilliferae]|uniref:Uncharacterized protein n=1 Tax=Candidatus Neptunichlamydia vexilliferae TaxID=1651774 RepID=A0ABS0B0C1_9BACT|nr:hypothetical protein [Candidatus Neptunochlamydia vexilliferae]